MQLEEYRDKIILVYIILFSNNSRCKCINEKESFFGFAVYLISLLLLIQGCVMALVLDGERIYFLEKIQICISKHTPKLITFFCIFSVKFFS